jgi:hypothetical protein
MILGNTYHEYLVLLAKLGMTSGEGCLPKIIMTVSSPGKGPRRPRWGHRRPPCPRIGIVTPKKILERGSKVDQKFDFLNRYSDGRSETADAKILSKRDCFTIHMLDSEVGWIMYE